MFSLRRPGPIQIDTALLRGRDERLIYAAVGGTRDAAPAGYRSATYELRLGTGPAVFARAVDALDTWAAQRSLGIMVTPDAPPREGDTVVLRIRLLVVWVVAVCRVVYRVDEPDRVGFAYGSLAQHPEQGEEAFFIERDSAGVVTARIAVFSRPNHWLVRLSGPVGPLVQSLAARGYLRGIRRHAVGRTGPARAGGGR